MITRRVPLRYTRAFRERDGARGAFEAEVRAAGMTPRVDTNSYREYGIKHVFRLRRMWADDIAVQLSETIIGDNGSHDELLDALAERDSGTGGIISKMAALGRPQVAYSETITVRAMDDAEVAFFGAQGPVYEIVHSGRDAGGALAERTTCALPCSLWTLEYSWEGEG
jgi:GntR family transcriptional regulator